MSEPTILQVMMLRIFDCARKNGWQREPAERLVMEIPDAEWDAVFAALARKDEIFATPIPPPSDDRVLWFGGVWLKRSSEAPCTL